MTQDTGARESVRPILLKQLPASAKDELQGLYARAREHEALAQRFARVRRIKLHIAAYPGKSYCYPEGE